MMHPDVSVADDFGRFKVVDGMTVYLGVIAADVLRDNPQEYTYHNPGKIPSGHKTYHVLLALFDKASGKRVTDAEVAARISPLGLAGPKKKFDPMTVAGVVTYCNYFRLSATDRYVIDAEIRRPGVSRTIRAKFMFKPDPG